jgi:hypothetical protein
MLLAANAGVADYQARRREPGSPSRWPRLVRTRDRGESWTVTMSPEVNGPCQNSEAGLGLGDVKGSSSSTKTRRMGGCGEPKTRPSCLTSVRDGVKRVGVVWQSDQGPLHRR